MKLVEYANQWHRLWSIRFNILTAALGAMAVAYSQLPDDWKQHIPTWIIAASAIATVLSAGASAVSAVIDQPALEKKDVSAQ